MRITINHKVIETNRHISQEEILKEFEAVRKAAKDPAQFQILYDRYFTMIFSFIFRKIDDEDSTADLTSQTFLKALRNIKKYKYKGVPFSAWLYRIASNEVNKYYRQSNKKLVFSFDEQEFENLIEQNIEEEKELDIDYIIRQMHALNESDIEVLELRFFESKSFAEMAFILEISEANAKMRTYRAIEKLRKLLKRREG
ncbi:MAG: sigma-70 family RNA polymerase sigma factor [Cyclobacteriaceae bacterium]|nr:sigma-70 family RNA polymerase sigma factor [Cyclobacteriaceae bacterium]MCK5370210.1 sigma-70 family RNA polymerase sigma factor [Cyclobacteriaceae bacterium]MCK5702122.1 sigma-70 family RNA polymerase sigma factor [Cyclobacteriaceae bacterium]